MAEIEALLKRLEKLELENKALLKANEEEKKEKEKEKKEKEKERERAEKAEREKEEERREKEEERREKEEERREKEKERERADKGEDIRAKGLPFLSYGGTNPSSAKPHKDYANFQPKLHIGSEVVIVDSFTLITGDDSTPREEAIKQLKDIPLRSHVWANAATRDHTAQHENGVVSFVEDLLSSFGLALGLKGALDLIEEGQTGNQKRADLLVIYNKHRKPLGAIEVKSPGFGKELDFKMHAGQIGTYLFNLHHLYGVEHPIGILTTFNQWHFCVLAKDRALLFEKGPACIIDPWKLNRRGDPFEFFFREVQDQRRLYHFLRGSNDAPTPTAAASKESEEGSSAFEFTSTQLTEEARNNLELAVSKRYSGADGSIAEVLASVLLRLAATSEFGFKRSFPCHLPYLSVVKGQLPRIKVKEMKQEMNFRLEGFPSKDAANFWLLQPASSGAEGQVWLASGAGGLICALKFFYEPVEEERRNQEMVIWEIYQKAISSSHSQIRERFAFWAKEGSNKEAKKEKKENKPTRSGKLHRWTDILVTPFLDFTYNRKNLSADMKAAVIASVSLLADQGYEHTDLAWRNIGFGYVKQGDEFIPHAILIDLPVVSQVGGDVAKVAIRQKMLDTLFPDG